ncbi:MAG: HU family DNA-binding protein [Ruminococcus sp.]|jgi:DNA-binding protein HU-beta|nr:HU family DNA-binding protein [Ruminococcus sp.]
MTKADFVSAVAAKGGFSKKDAEKAVNAFTGAVNDALIAGESVQLIGFGTFEVRDKQATTAINPKTKEKINVPAKKVAKFKAGKTLSESVNG